MIHDSSHLPTILTTTRSSFLAWAGFAASVAFSVAVVGLEIWLRVPARRVFNQLHGLKRPPAGPIGSMCQHYKEF